VLVRLGAEAKLVDTVNDLAQVVAALDLVLDLPEYLGDFVFDGVGAGSAFFELLEVREELLVDEVAEVVAGEGVVVVELAGLVLRRGPGFPALRLFEDVGVFLALKLCLGGAVLFEAVEVFQEEEPGCLLGVVELGRATGFLAESVVDVSEGLLEHGFPRFPWVRVLRVQSWGQLRYGQVGGERLSG
jgi:hypothetical protein